uniref:CCHC-type domain-containing protein n=1 Tax=Micrurus lemniscatus lemniscatus TaxID=129467 RepID=A0A2D4HHH3_MICLE
MLNERFIAQSYDDIQNKLQKLEGELGKNTTELLEVARKVFVNRDKVEKKEKDACMHKKTELLAVALQGGAVLGPNQCALCGSEVHWQQECPRWLMRGRFVLRRLFGRGLSGRGMMGRGRPPRYPFRGRGPQRAKGGRGTVAEEAGVEGIGLAGTGWTD